jgi:hypothetical protein
MADMVGNSWCPMANTGALFRDLRSAILAATNIGVSPRAGLLTKPAGAWSVATIKVRGSTAGRLRKAPAVTREVRFRREAVAAARSGGGPLTDWKPGVHTLWREALKMPLTGHRTNTKLPLRPASV